MIKIGSDKTAHAEVLTVVADNPGLVTLTASDPACILTPSSFTVGGAQTVELLANGWDGGVARRHDTDFVLRKNFTVGIVGIFKSKTKYLYAASCEVITNRASTNSLWNWAIGTNSARKFYWYNDGPTTVLLFNEVQSLDVEYRAVFKIEDTTITLITPTSTQSLSRGAPSGGYTLPAYKLTTFFNGVYNNYYLRHFQLLNSVANAADITAFLNNTGDLGASLYCKLSMLEESGTKVYDLTTNRRDFDISPTDQGSGGPGANVPGIIRTITTPFTNQEQSIAFDTAAIAPGTAITVTATRTKAGFPTGRTPDISTESDTCVITAAAAPGSLVVGVALDKVSTSIDIDGTETINATVFPSTATIRTLTWASSDPAKATVHPTTGEITGVANGVCNVIATTDDGGYTATCQVHVPLAHVEGISLNKVNTSIAIGASETLIATLWPSYAAIRGVTWTTSDPLIATVSVIGKVDGIGHGICDVIATTVDGSYAAHCHVTVPTIAVGGVSIHETSLTISSLGHSETLVADVWPASASDKSVTWWSSNPSIATVSAIGLVTSIAYGTCIIRATTTDGGFTHDCTVYVQNPTLSQTTAQAMGLRHYGQI
jgi:uncharacterized protein YjdB